MPQMGFPNAPVDQQLSLRAQTPGPTPVALHQQIGHLSSQQHQPMHYQQQMPPPPPRAHSRPVTTSSNLSWPTPTMPLTPVPSQTTSYRPIEPRPSNYQLNGPPSYLGYNTFSNLLADSLNTSPGPQPGGYVFTQPVAERRHPEHPQAYQALPAIPAPPPTRPPPPSQTPAGHRTTVPKSIGQVPAIPRFPPDATNLDRMVLGVPFGATEDEYATIKLKF